MNMSFKSAVTTDGDVTIVRLEGKITLGDGSGALRDAVRNVLANGATNVLLDLGGVSYIDSSGLGELVGCYAAAHNRGAKMKLLHLQKRVEGLMQITRLTTLFETFEDEAQAVQSFHDKSAASN
jgi:anti-sigma B factor antagonist